jgi:Methyltransferase domain
LGARRLFAMETLNNATLQHVALSFLAIVFALPFPSHAQAPASTAVATPTEEVPYVQTPSHVVHRMMQLAEVGAGDLLWDLGSGDGRIVIAAAKRGARAVGFEIDPRLIAESSVNAKRAGVAARTRFVEQDIFTLNFATPSVVSLYLLPEYNLKLRPLLLSQMKPGSRVVSHEWDMGDWSPDETLIYPSPAKPHGTKKEHRALLWVIPARIEGRWRVTTTKREPFSVNIAQQFQKLTAQSSATAIAWMSLRGTTLRFALRDGARLTEYEGRVASDLRTIVGRGWRADRE